MFITFKIQILQIIKKICVKCLVYLLIFTKHQESPSSLCRNYNRIIKKIEFVKMEIQTRALVESDPTPYILVDEKHTSSCHLQ